MKSNKLFNMIVEKIKSCFYKKIDNPINDNSMPEEIRVASSFENFCNETYGYPVSGDCMEDVQHICEYLYPAQIEQIFRMKDGANSASDVGANSASDVGANPASDVGANPASDVGAKINISSDESAIGNKINNQLKQIAEIGSCPHDEYYRLHKRNWGPDGRSWEESATCKNCGRLFIVRKGITTKGETGVEDHVMYIHMPKSCEKRNGCSQKLAE